MKENAVVVGIDGVPIYWHTPLGRTHVALPDSRALWDVLWEHRHHLLGVAHSHPGHGQPQPSQEDLTTFAAIEAALGKRLYWWITSRDKCSVCTFDRRDRSEGRYVVCKLEPHNRPTWLAELRRISYE